MPHDSRAIGCLGWGSLVWNPRELPLRSRWFEDGPLLPIEFAREACDGRITLVICNVSHRVRACWALMSTGDLQTARQQLASREGVREKDIETSIGYWEAASGRSRGAAADDIAQWAQAKRLDAVVWANLEIGLKGNRGTVPPIEAVLAHLRGLPHAQAIAAERYIRKAPRQIDTDYRRRIAEELDWRPE